MEPFLILVSAQCVQQKLENLLSADFPDVCYIMLNLESVLKHGKHSGHFIRLYMGRDDSMFLADLNPSLFVQSFAGSL